jgi:hypothetical protein
MADKKANYRGIVLGGILALTIVFIMLKLLDVITWSWMWVLSPIWIWGIIFAVYSVLVLIRMILALVWKM